MHLTSSSWPEICFVQWHVNKKLPGWQNVPE
jgi:hypothetical protein